MPSVGSQKVEDTHTDLETLVEMFSLPVVGWADKGVMVSLTFTYWVGDKTASYEEL